MALQKYKDQIKILENKIKNAEESKKSYLISIGHIHGSSYDLNIARKMDAFNKSVNKKSNQLACLHKTIKNIQRNNARSRFINIIITYFKIRKPYLEKKERKRNNIKNKFIELSKTYLTLWYGVKKGDKNEHKIRKMCRNVLCVRQKNKCAICGYSMDNDITFEHIIPVSKGGLTGLFNGKAVHKSCNSYIGVLPIERKSNMFIELGAECNNDYKKYEDEYDDTYDADY